ncbi:MAG: lytic transglycosylase domain-containing protein [Steroidobacteraceae bacterium]
MSRISAIVLGVTFAAAALTARADIYSFVDSNGISHYTNVPTDPRYSFLIGTPGAKTESGDAYNPALLARASQYDLIIEKAAAHYSLEPNLLRAVIVVESGFNARAVSKKGAVGLMQLMPATARQYGAENAYDPKQNVHAGARYLRSLLDRYGADLKLVLAAYNAGEDAVDRNGGRIPPYKETQAYVPRVLKIYQSLAKPRAAEQA